MSTPELSLAKEVKGNEWLAREALWAIAKSPLNIQWERWKAHPEIEDPGGVLGLVIGGNVQRASINLSQSELFDAGTEDRNIILGRVAEHIGKLAGGMLALQVMVTSPSEDWEKPYPYYLDTVVSASQQFQSSKRGGSLTETAAYYDMLSPAHAAVLKSRSGDENRALIQESVIETAAMARTAWQEFLDSNPNILIVPGATPRSTGSQIETLRAQFEPYAQLVTNSTKKSN